jgi:hypothetical protein
MLARTMRPPIELATDSEATARSGPPVYVLCQILDGKLKAIAQISAPGAPAASRSIRLEANGDVLAMLFRAGRRSVFGGKPENIRSLRDLPVLTRMDVRPCVTREPRVRGELKRLPNVS